MLCPSLALYKGFFFLSKTELLIAFNQTDPMRTFSPKIKIETKYSEYMFKNQIAGT